MTPFERRIKRAEAARVKYYMETGARTTALKFAKSKGWKYRTWQEDGNLVVLRVV